MGSYNELEISCSYQYNQGCNIRDIHQLQICTFTGNGGGNAFTIAHDIAFTPTQVNVIPKSAAAAPFHVTVDANNITVTYESTTGAGTNNISLWWSAKL